MTAQDKQDAPAKVPHLGDIVRNLREASGLTRRVFGEAVRLSEPVVKSFELGRITLSTE